ncbi:MAG: hypothetical protein HQL84_04700 [Magnetococcales bacterium]|nr:hypothetical protein [Magnetococcales bacterium]MBF0149328.1 hypothetical protein [Magnetococcales bacterium]MBF0174566.1 hypothetical protein [Magnetococcales bacterium]MBF0347529.1 hypothetical protein [Magnetococcales bacterium]MBF0629606.1 hypothetical protein [Magnetococcales bacterium]
MRRLGKVMMLVVGCGLLGGCSSSVSLPWEQDLLDPGRVATREPLEIPPDLSELPNPDVKKKEESPLEPWVSPDVSAGKGGGTREGRNDRLPFAIPTVREDKEGLSRNEKENLPGWMDAPIKAH